MINNNVLAVFSILLIMLTLTEQAIILTVLPEEAPAQEVTGLVSSSGTVTLTIVLPLSSVNFTADLEYDNASVLLSWSNYTADNYSVYATINMSAGFNYSDPLASGLIVLEYNDTNASAYMQRYYALGVWNNGTEQVLDTNVGKFNILLEAASLTPGQVELNSASLPLLPDDPSIGNILRNGDVNDVISTYNTSRTPPAYDSIQKFPMGWFGQFAYFLEGRGYDMTIVGARYNLTIVGTVPTGDYTAELKSCSLTPGDIEMNSVGWASAYTKCDLNTILGNTSNVGDVISTYNPYRSPPAYDSIQKFPGGWFGQFSCFEPGKGYTFTIVGTGYNWTYSQEP
jgi:hypothetical protein